MLKKEKAERNRLKKLSELERVLAMIKSIHEICDSEHISSDAQNHYAKILVILLEKAQKLSKEI